MIAYELLEMVHHCFEVGGLREDLGGNKWFCRSPVLFYQDIPVGINIDDRHVCLCHVGEVQDDDWYLSVCLSCYVNPKFLSTSTHKDFDVRNRRF